MKLFIKKLAVLLILPLVVCGCATDSGLSERETGGLAGAALGAGGTRLAVVVARAALVALVVVSCSRHCLFLSGWFALCGFIPQSFGKEAPALRLPGKEAPALIGLVKFTTH